MLKAQLGTNGPSIPRIGYGAMVLEGYYGTSDDITAVDTLSRAMDLGLMIDSADAYGNGHNEVLIAKALEHRGERPFIATKFGLVFEEGLSAREINTGWGFSLRVNASPEYAKTALDASLRRLNLNQVDLWYLHYPDPEIEIEETISAMADAVDAGKVRYLGLSNVTAEQVRRAHSVHPINAVQYEYSLWRREVETELLPTLRDLGIALVAWSPLGSGFLTGTVTKLDESDFRQSNPKLSGDNFEANKKRFEKVTKIASELKLTPAQLALAWLLSQGEDIFPIPGTRKSSRIDENLLSASTTLTQELVDRINQITAPGAFVGETLL
ncbi:MAG: aldo/keto reductase [Arenicellales bacterium]|nr:aldo/keto reductase [Arenicellales bacterium]